MFFHWSGFSKTFAIPGRQFVLHGVFVATDLCHIEFVVTMVCGNGRFLDGPIRPVEAVLMCLLFASALSALSDICLLSVPPSALSSLALLVLFTLRNLISARVAASDLFTLFVFYPSYAFRTLSFRPF